MLRPYALAAVTETPEGIVQLGLVIIEAGSLHAAEAHVMAQCTGRGELIRGLVSRSCEFTEEVRA